MATLYVEINDTFLSLFCIVKEDKILSGSPLGWSGDTEVRVKYTIKTEIPDRDVDQFVGKKYNCSLVMDYLMKELPELFL